MKYIFYYFLIITSPISCKKATSLVNTLKSKKDYYILKNTGENLNITFLTFNILASIDFKALSEGYDSWAKREAKVISYIKKKNADFVAIQESTAGQLDFIEKNFANKYFIVENKSYTPDSILLVRREGFEIIEKGHWILLKDATEVGIRRVAVWAKVRHLRSKREMMVVGVHVDAKAIKKEQIEKLFSYLDKHKESRAPLFVAGDFNTKPSDNDFKIITDKDWHDSYIKTKGDNDATYPAKNPTRRIDHIFYYPSDILSTRIWNVDKEVMSDHLPVFSEIHIKKK